MKKLVSLFYVFSLLAIPAVVNAQVSAVMQVSARVVNSTSIETHSAITSLNDLNSADQSLNAGSLSLKTLPGTSVNFFIKENPVLINKNGEHLELKDMYIMQANPENGEHNIQFKGKVSGLGDIKEGNYQGHLTAVIEYL